MFTSAKLPVYKILVRELVYVDLSRVGDVLCVVSVQAIMCSGACCCAWLRGAACRCAGLRMAAYHCAQLRDAASGACLMRM